MTANKPLIRITAHRGASGHAPENTLAAINAALLMGADSIEIDTRLSADGVAVVIHDPSLDRTTDGSGYVSDLNLNRLREYDAGSWYGREFRGEPIPTLKEVIDTVKNRAFLNIELKAEGDWEGLVQAVGRVIKAEGFTGECMMTSFNRPAIERAQDLDKGISTGLIIDNEPDGAIFSGNHGILSVDYRLVNDDFLDKSSRAGKEVHVWTVNREKDMRRMIAFGVRGIMTNYPDRLFKILSEKK